ncbi:MAG TPA: hypothetical protein VFN10_19980 [Thermoanaerobaculia bacterium]|nr:hypothetical protein [Thermoanaerobaculia bacterium]
MSDTRFFLVVTGLALISVGLTFILFRFLKSSAEGKGKLLGGTITYGGSLAGFVLIFTMLFGAFYRLRSDPGVTTPINIEGHWKVELQTSKGGTIDGTATIRQRHGDPIFSMSGEISGTKPITFDSMVGMIRERDIYLIYENLEGERGIIRGKVTADKPNTLRLVYTDLAGYDRNADPTGMLILERMK